MEVKEADRVVIAKPVASRPICSSYRSFSELLAGAINASPHASCSETAVAAIRPKTVRVRPQACQTSDTFRKSDNNKASVVYKPLAKLVSKTTVSLLASMGNYNLGSQQADLRVKHTYQDKSQAETEKTNVPTEDQKSSQPAIGVDRPSYDGYNWRKYGQKQVKGSEYPRSYYKCTHPNCPVKKKVERSFDGQIAEIVYKGEHNHVKPQPPKRVSSMHAPNTNIPLWNNDPLEGSKVIETILPSDNHAHTENSCGISGDCDEESKGKDMDDDEPRSKRRKYKIQSCEVGTLAEAAAEPRVTAHNSPDTEIVGDGFRWRKYGQKVVKGNPYPRSYYRCTSLKCNVRKHVERTSEDSKAFITTYEGKHNHEMPVRNTHQPASEPGDPHAATLKNKR